MHPSPTWLTSFLSTQNPRVPAASLNRTALFRLLASNITQTLQRTPSTTFPRDIADPTIPTRSLTGPIVVQILDIEDVGRSRWSQIEALEAAERGETRKGHEIIRTVPGETETADAGAGTDAEVASAGAGGGPWKLLVQDAAGTRAYAFEMESVEGVGGETAIGAKMVLRNVIVARGVVMLEAKGVVWLGGKIEEMDKAWREGRKGRLKSLVDGEHGD